MFVCVLVSCWYLLQSLLVKKVFDELRNVLVLAAKHKQPAQVCSYNSQNRGRVWEVGVAPPVEGVGGGCGPSCGRWVWPLLWEVGVAPPVEGVGGGCATI